MTADRAASTPSRRGAGGDSVDERGFLRITGRIKDMVIRGGENIYPREIEQVLFDHPGVADVAVVGVPDPTWGEQVAAFVRAATGPAPTATELADHCRQRLARHKVPRFWTFVDEFPMTGSGKIQKYVLRDGFVASRDMPGAGGRDAPPAPAGQATEEGGVPVEG
jgi:acyl-CoA synthetase (AMP-forming)/AMP-acid ligase II